MVKGGVKAPPAKSSEASLLHPFLCVVEQAGCVLIYKPKQGAVYRADQLCRKEV